MIVAGVMSGTSADGINVALVRVDRLRVAGRERPALHFLGHAEYPYPKQVRSAVLAAMNSTKASVADLARLNFLLAELYADAVLATQRRFRLKAELVGCHGQTLYHQGEPGRFLGRKLAVTWQTGEGAVIAARVGCRWFPIFVRPTWRPAAKERRWFPFSIFFYIATIVWAALCRTSAASRTLPRFRPALLPSRCWLSTPARATW